MRFSLCSLLFLTELLLHMQIVSSTLTLVCCVPLLCFLRFSPSSAFSSPPPQQELAGSLCSGRQEVWIQNLAEAGCIMRLHRQDKASPMSSSVLCPILFLLVQTGTLGFAMGPEGWRRAWAKGAVCCGTGVDLWPEHLCVPCRVYSGTRCWICSQGDSWPPEQTPAQPRGHAHTNLLGAALICWVKHCAEGLGCFHWQSCQGAVSLGGLWVQCSTSTEAQTRAALTCWGRRSVPVGLKDPSASSSTLLQVRR